ncbi:MAG TPA: F0F1 ATP synthase subunit A [Spirochaetia bacterium]|nr:F0F1 ATP synthase subunit A [Spirochaetia bacterium]
MNPTPDGIVFLTSGFITLNGTIVFTWFVMVVLVAISVLASRNLSSGKKISRWQNALEVIVGTVRKQMKEMLGRDDLRYLSFVGALFLFISLSNLLAVLPFYEPPTGSFSMAAALAVTVFFAVPVFGVAEKGVGGYLRHYIEPSPLMLPFNIISELSRTLSLAVRLFGNIMSGTMIVGVLLSIAPILVPLIMEALGLLIGQIQAYIFAALATVYIGSAIRSRAAQERKNRQKTSKGEDNG